MFVSGFAKSAAVSLNRVPTPFKFVRPHARIDTFTARDGMGASKRSAFSAPISRFGTGQKPRMALKSISGAARGTA